MLTRLGKWVVVLMLVVATGGHWALLQSAAWVGMAFKYSQAAPFKVALVKTFDGKHPCQLCRLVSEGKKSEKKQGRQNLIVKIDFFLAARALGITPPTRFEGPWPPAAEVLERRESPLTPPPRHLHV